MADNTATASANAEPVVDPIPNIFLQFDTRWANQIVRPPLKEDGTEITTEADLKDAFESSENTWLSTGCHVVTGAMLVDWLCNLNPLTKGNVIVPNLDLTQPITPPRVAAALFQDGTDPNQKTFVSSSTHPPYIPHKTEGTKWTTDHGGIQVGFKQLKLKTDAAPEGEAIKLSSPSLVVLLPETLGQHVFARKGLQKKQKDLTKKLADNAAKAAELEGKEDDKSKAKLEQLKKDRAKLEEQQTENDAKLATNPAGDDGKYDPSRVAINRQKNKELLKRALLRGPVLLNMKVSPHFILLVGYREEKLYIIDPGRVIHKQWFGKEPDVTKLPAQVSASSSDLVIIEGNKEFDKIGKSGAKLSFLDNLLGFESYFFGSVGDQVSYNTVTPPVGRAIVEKDVRRK
jgi:hypothetical protein